MTTTTVPAAVQARYRASLDKDAALVELAALKAAQEAAETLARRTRQLMHLIAANEPRLRGATGPELGAAMKVKRARVVTIKKESGGFPNCAGVAAGLAEEITAGLAAVSEAVEVYRTTRR